MLPEPRSSILISSVLFVFVYKYMFVYVYYYHYYHYYHYLYMCIIMLYECTLYSRVVVLCLVINWVRSCIVPVVCFEFMLLYYVLKLV